MTAARPLRTIADVEPGDHLCCLYDTEEQHRALLTPFLRQGLRRGERVLYIVNAHAAETVLGYLREDGMNVEPYLAKGQLRILTADDTFTREGTFNPDGVIAWLRAETERALAGGYPALRVTGEMSWALSKISIRELVEHEARLNEFFPGSPKGSRGLDKCLAMCQYDRRQFDPAVLLDVLRTHPIVVINTEVYDNLYYIPPAEFLGGDLPAAKLRQWVRNLAEHKQAEQALQVSEERYRSLFDGVPVGLYRTTPAGQILDANPALVEMTGHPNRESLLTHDVIEGYVNPEDRRRWQALIEHDGVVRGFETRWRRRDGTIISVRDSARAAYDGQRQVLYYEGAVEDITEHKALEEMRRRYEFIASASGDFMTLISKGYTYEVVNDSYCRAHHKTREEIIGKTVADIWGAEVFNKTIKAYLDRCFAGNEVHYQTWFEFAVPGLRYFDVAYYPYYNHEGAVTHAVVVSRDITERKRAEQALQESHRQLESRERFITRLLESIPSSLVVIDRSLRVVSANRNFLEKTRRDAQTISGRKIEEVFPPVLFEYTRLDQRVRDVFRTGQPVEGGKVSYRAPGLPTRVYYYRLIPLKLALSPAEGASETVENVMVLMDDITEREQLGEEVRRVERHLASVVDCANDVVISMDPQGRIVTWNRAAERASGRRAEQVISRPLLSLCAAEQQSVMAEMLRKVARGDGVRNIEVNLLTANGQAVPIAWSCSSMRDDAGKVAGVVAVGRDLTEQRRLEAQLIHSAKMASLGVMAGGIAHELRNPLGIISANAQLLLEHPDDSELRSQCAQKVHTATKRASLIIENLLKFARPQSEHKAEMKEVDLPTVLEETIAMLAHQMTLQKVILHKEFRPNPPKVYGNSELLQQVFTNLMLNACTAMPQGGTLVVATRVTETGQVEIRFSDSGCGIPPEHLSKIFDPFFTTMPVGKGTGLGLAISYSIIQQHQGTIEVESRVGQGSTFVVRLPGMAGSR